MVFFRRAPLLTYPLLSLAKHAPNLIGIFMVFVNPIDRLLPVSVALTWVDSCCKKNFDDFQVAVLYRIEQRRIFVVVYAVQTAAGIDEKLDDVIASVNRGNLERRVPGIV